jgi:hypothetical protein
MNIYSNWRIVHVFIDDVGNVYPTKVHRVWHGLHLMAKIPYFHKTILLSILFWPLHCLSFLDLLLFITPLVSSFFSWKLNAITLTITLTFTSDCYQMSQIKKCKIFNHIFCCNMLVFACPIIAKSQCWLFALRANTGQISVFALYYSYLPSYIRICPLIQLPVSAQWS